MRKNLRRRVSIAALAMLALAALGRAQTRDAASPATASPASASMPQPLASPHIPTHEQLLKMIRLNERMGSPQEIIGAAATALHLSRNEDLPVHGLDYSLGGGHEIDFARLRQDADGFVFTEMNGAGNFMFRVDSALNPVAAVRIIGATAMTPIVVVPLSLGEPEARDNLSATLSA